VLSSAGRDQIAADEDDENSTRMKSNACIVSAQLCCDRSGQTSPGSQVAAKFFGKGRMLSAPPLPPFVSKVRTDPGRLFHSDRGSQFASAVYRQLLAQHGLIASMSRPGNCYDNAFIESFWSTLKYELVYHRRFATRAEARTAVFDYIETFYNRTRLHSSLDYLSPIHLESKLN
jgi:putative transposase